MVSSFNITVHDLKGTYDGQLIEVPYGEKATNTLSFAGRQYSIEANDEETKLKVIAILKSLYPEAVFFSESIDKNISKAAVGLDSISRRISDLSQVKSISNSSQEIASTNSWAQKNKSCLEDFKKRIIEGVLKKAKKDPVFSEMFLLQDGSDEIFMQLFPPIIESLSEWQLMNIARDEKLDFSPNEDYPANYFIFDPDSLEQLDLFIRCPEVAFSGVLIVKDINGKHFFSSENAESSDIFAMHSIGKVFTEVLAILLISEGSLSEDVMNQPVQLNPEDLSLLPIKVQKYLKEKQPTLHELLTHKSGLDDYLVNYIEDLREAIQSQQEPSDETDPRNCKALRDFLKYADDKDLPKKLDELDPLIGDIHYSNLGFLLAGLSLEYLTGLPYDILLQTYLISPFGMKPLLLKPEEKQIEDKEVRFNSNDPVAKHISATPAGGYWTTSENLCEFGIQVSKKFKADSQFQHLIEKYGQEFYSQKDHEIRHSGGIDSASAYLSAFVEHGVVITVMTDKDHATATEMYNSIIRNMLHKP